MTQRAFFGGGFSRVSWLVDNADVNKTFFLKTKKKKRGGKKREKCSDVTHCLPSPLAVL